MKVILTCSLKKRKKEKKRNQSKAWTLIVNPSVSNCSGLEVRWKFFLNVFAEFLFHHSLDLNGSVCSSERPECRWGGGWGGGGGSDKCIFFSCGRVWSLIADTVLLSIICTWPWRRKTAAMSFTLPSYSYQVNSNSNLKNCNHPTRGNFVVVMAGS